MDSKSHLLIPRSLLLQRTRRGDLQEEKRRKSY